MNTSKNKPFDSFKKNIYSQNGEDGVLSEILKRLSLNTKNHLCVEFGAWDGKHLSNTFNLVKLGWDAIYIEGDPVKFKDLIDTANEYPKIKAINCQVESDPDSEASLNSILLRNNVDSNFDLLSIDVDSFDLDIWESLSNFQPKIVVIEINSSVPPGVLQRHSFNRQGNSFSSTLEVAKVKGYSLVCHTGNLIFVKNSYVTKLFVHERFFLYPELLFDDGWLK